MWETVERESGNANHENEYKSNLTNRSQIYDFIQTPKEMLETKSGRK